MANLGPSKSCSPRGTPAVACFIVLAVTATGPVVGSSGPAARSQTPREWTVTARRCGFSPDRIEVNRGDLVKITLVAEDGPHSLTIEKYRISKRASKARSATIEFRADEPGSHEFYCNLTMEGDCRRMRGELVVR
jgi:cytochrome c oxidase subunit II